MQPAFFVSANKIKVFCVQRKEKLGNSGDTIESLRGRFVAPKGLIFGTNLATSSVGDLPRLSLWPWCWCLLPFNEYQENNAVLLPIFWSEVIFF